MTERWKADNLLHFDQAQEALATVPIANLDAWLTVRRRLDQVASIKRAAVVFLSRSEARIDVQYLGDLAQLKLALAQRDLILTEEGEGLVLRLARRHCSSRGRKPRAARGVPRVLVRIPVLPLNEEARGRACAWAARRGSSPSRLNGRVGWRRRLPSDSGERASES